MRASFCEAILRFSRDCFGKKPHRNDLHSNPKRVYLSLNYEITLRKMTRKEAGSNEPRYLAQIPLLKGVMAEGKEPQEALAHLARVQRMAFELMLAQGKNIPEPLPEELHAEFV